MGNTKLKIEDVAEAAKVSRATAWRALNRPNQVSDKTVEKVKSAARNIGYVPDMSARTLRTNRSGLVAMVVPAIDIGFGYAIQKTSEVALATGQEIILGVTGYDTEKENDIIRQMLGRRASVLILSGNDQTEETRKMIAASGVSVIQIWEAEGTPMQSMIGFSNYDLGYSAGQRLISKGRKSLGFLHAPLRPRSARRIAGFRAAILDAGLPDCDSRYIAVNDDAAKVADALDTLFKCHPDVDGLFANGDVLALLSISELKSRGIMVPLDMSVLAFGNPYYAGLIEPKLTRMAIPEKTIGDMAAETLAKIIENGESPNIVADLGFELIEGETD